MKRLEDYYKEGMKLPWWWSGLKVMAVMQGRMLDDLAEKLYKQELMLAALQSNEFFRKEEVKKAMDLHLQSAGTHAANVEVVMKLKKKVEELEKRMDADPEIESQEIMKSTMEGRVEDFYKFVREKSPGPMLRDEEPDVPVLD